MTNIASLNGLAPPDQSVPETIRLLEEMLEKARSGEIRSVAVVTVKANGNVTSCWHSEDQFHTLLGALSWISHRMNAGEL